MLNDLDDDLNEGLDPEGPSPEDLDRFGAEFKACPSCGASIYDQADLCHKCGHVFEQAPSGIPIWALVTTGLVLLGFIAIVLRQIL